MQKEEKTENNLAMYLTKVPGKFILYLCLEKRYVSCAGRHAFFCFLYNIAEMPACYGRGMGSVFCFCTILQKCPLVIAGAWEVFSVFCTLLQKCPRVIAGTREMFSVLGMYCRA